MKEKHKSGELISPFSNSDTHQKTMDSRKRNATNIFVTNNPMLNEETVMKKMISMPDMRGRKQSMNIVNGDRKQQTEHPDPIQDWVNIGFTKGISKPSCQIQVFPPSSTPCSCQVELGVITKSFTSSIILFPSTTVYPLSPSIINRNADAL